MKQTLIKQEVINVINECLPNKKIGHLSDHFDLINDLGIDSFTFISILLSIEDTLDITFSDEEFNIETLRCYENLEKCIANLLNRS